MGTIYKGGVAYAGGASNPGNTILGGIVASVAALPAQPASGTMYLVGSADPYQLYIYANSAWRRIGIDTTALSVGTLAVTNRLTIPTGAPASPVMGDFWVE